MSARLATLVRHDARLQWRYGIYIAYAVIVAFYVLILIQLEAYLPDWAPALVFYTDPSVLGFFFLGALMMLERAENTRSALAISPVTAANYFWSKTLTLTAIALTAVLSIAPFMHNSINWFLLVTIITLTSVQFVAIGVPAALYFKTVTGYLIGAAGFMTPIIGPGFIALIDPMPAWAIIIPSAAQFKLILVATGTHDAGTVQVALMLVVSAVAAGATVLLALGLLKKEFGK